jgi:uncharacterized radical SAM superfamily protein
MNEFTPMPTIYFDMDGVLAKWNNEASVEDTFEEGYFLNREPDEKMVNVVKRLRKLFGNQIQILSSVYQNGYAEKEKIEWLSKNGIDDVQRQFVPYEHRKDDYINAEEPAILIDDFSQNLHYWVETDEHVAIKYFNGINGTKHTWDGNSISYEMSEDEIIESIMNVVFSMNESEED